MSDHRFDPLTQICDCGVSAQDAFDGKKRNPCPARRETMVDEGGREVALIFVAGGLIMRGAHGAKLIAFDGAGVETLYELLGRL